MRKAGNPKSNKTSMGIYMLTGTCRRTVEDANDKNSKRFRQDIIPKMLGKGFRMYGYEFKGYWKDVGTIESYGRRTWTRYTEAFPA